MLPVNTLLKNLRADRNKGNTGRTAAGKTNRDAPSFGDQLLQQISAGDRDQMKQQLAELQQRLEQAGDELERNPTAGNLEVFRALLSGLVDKVVKTGFRVDNVGPGWHPADRHQIIRQIDAEAENLLQLVMNEQKDRMAIARKLINIKGLVIDLLS